MKTQCDKVLTVDGFSEEYASWKGRSLTIMNDQIKVSQDCLKPRYYDTIYLFEDSGILVGFTYNDVVPECYITTKDGLESEPFADVAPYIFEDLGRAYAVVKKQYRNTDLRKHVIGLNLVEIHSLDPVYQKFTWPMWECIESMHNGAILIKKAEANYALSTIDTFPACYIANNAVMITKEEDEENTYCMRPSALSSEVYGYHKDSIKNQTEIMVLNNQIIERLKEKSNLSLDKAKDFTILSASILDETKRYMGVTTIKRLLGYINDCRKTNEYTLNTIAIYLGCKSWNELCSSLRIDSDWNFEDEKVYVSDLEIGKLVSVIYWNREVTFEVIDFKGNKALKVTKVLNSSLKVDDILIIDCLEVGKTLEAKEVYRDSLVGNYRTNNELSEINIA